MLRIMIIHGDIRTNSHKRKRRW